MAALIPVDAPTLTPLRGSFEYDQLESEMKAVFLAVFESMLRASERRLNLYGMPHLGDSELIERAMKDAGLSIVRRNTTRTSFLLKAARARNPRRGMIFLRQYLQSVWPNVWQVEPLWHPVATAANYPADRTALGTKSLGDGVTAEYAPDSEDGIPTLYRTDWQGKQKLYPTPRTNRVLRSQEFDNASWSKSEMTVVANAGLAPDGTATADRLVPSTVSTGNHYVQPAAQVAVVAGDRFTASCFFTAEGYTRAQITLSGTTWQGGVQPVLRVDLTTGTPYSVSAAVVAYSVTPVGSGYQLSITAIASSSFSTRMAVWVMNPNGTGSAWAGDGVKGLLAWGAQQEVNTSGSYIPTTTANVTVTDYTLDANGVATFAGGLPASTPVTHFRTGRIRITLPVTTDNGLGLVEIAKAFRSTLAPRLMLELRLATVMENIGNGGALALSNGMRATMPFMGIGTLKKG